DFDLALQLGAAGAVVEQQVALEAGAEGRLDVAAPLRCGFLAPVVPVVALRDHRCGYAKRQQRGQRPQTKRCTHGRSHCCGGLRRAPVPKALASRPMSYCGLRISISVELPERRSVTWLRTTVGWPCA